MNIRNRMNWRVAAVFTLIGPPVGGLALILSLEVPRFAVEPTMVAFGSLASKLTPMLLGTGAVYSYIFGFLPALVTGLIASVLWGSHRLRTNPWIRTAIGGAIGFGVMVLMQYQQLDGSDAYGDPLAFALLGATGGAASGLVAGRWVAPNNSFNPMPLRGTG